MTPPPAGRRVHRPRDHAAQRGCPGGPLGFMPPEAAVLRGGRRVHHVRRARVRRQGRAAGRRRPVRRCGRRRRGRHRRVARRAAGCTGKARPAARGTCGGVGVPSGGIDCCGGRPRSMAVGCLRGLVAAQGGVAERDHTMRGRRGRRPCGPAAYWWCDGGGGAGAIRPPVRRGQDGGAPPAGRDRRRRRRRRHRGGGRPGWCKPAAAAIPSMPPAPLMPWPLPSLPSMPGTTTPARPKLRARNPVAVMGGGGGCPSDIPLKSDTPPGRCVSPPGWWNIMPAAAPALPAS